MGSLPNLDFARPGCFKSSCFAAVLHETARAYLKHLSHVSRPATGGSTGCGGMGLVLVVFASLCVLPSALACIHFLRAARNACTTNYRVRVPFFYASSGVPLFLCFRVVLFLYGCRGSYHEQIRIRARKRDVAIERQCHLLHPPLPRPHPSHSSTFPLFSSVNVPLAVCTAVLALHLLVQLGANPTMLEQLLMEMFVPDTTQVYTANYNSYVVLGTINRLGGYFSGWKGFLNRYIRSLVSSFARLATSNQYSILVVLLLPARACEC